MMSLNLTKHFYKKPTVKSPVIFAWHLRDVLTLL